jgi:hypothetical protein
MNNIIVVIKLGVVGCVFSSFVEGLPTMHKALDSIPSTENKQNMWYS